MTELKTANLIKGGAFLIEDIEADRVFTPEDFTDEQKMIAKTTEDYVLNEVVPVIDNLENHEFEHSVRLLKKAGDFGLLGADVPEEYGGLGLDAISSALNFRKNVTCGWIFNYTRRACRNWNVTNCLIWYGRTKGKVFTKLCNRR